MRLYAIRDRLIDYFMKPFTAHSDREVLASLASAINNPGNNDAIANAPQQFELWRLAEINEQTGQVQGDREFLADCAALVRGGLRGAGIAGAETATRARAQIEDAPGRTGGNGNATPGPAPDQARPEALQGAKAPQGHPGGHTGGNGGGPAHGHGRHDRRPEEGPGGED